MGLALWSYLVLLLGMIVLMGWPSVVALLLLALLAAAIVFALYLGYNDSKKAAA